VNQVSEVHLRLSYDVKKLESQNSGFQCKMLDESLRWENHWDADQGLFLGSINQSKPTLYFSYELSGTDQKLCLDNNNSEDNRMSKREK
jgi:hypothetical protein